MVSTTPSAKLKALENILALEERRGFANTAVAGGLDRFLAGALAEAPSHQMLRRLAEHGMLTVAYGELTVAKREAWVNEVRRLLRSSEAPAPATKAATPKRAPAASKKPPEPPATKSASKSPEPPAKPAISIDSPATVIAGVGPAVAEKLGKLGVSTIRDLVYLLPKRHEDFSLRSTVSQLQPGMEQTAVVSLWNIREVQLGRGGHLRATEATVGDETGNIRVLWFGNPWLVKTLQASLQRAQAALAGSTALGGTPKLVLSGKVSVFNGRRQFDSPEWEVIEDLEMANLVHTGRMVPVYPLTEGLYQRNLRRIVREALDIALGDAKKGTASQIVDSMDDATRRRPGLMPLARAIAQMHYPDSGPAYEEARRRLAFDELLVLQLAIAARKKLAEAQTPGIPLKLAPEVLESFTKSLPFTLTKGQQSAIKDALGDMTTATRPMSRLLQGDVGSGKTVVALALMLVAVADGYQSALMAPTEVLAEQHFLSIGRLLNRQPPLNEPLPGFKAKPSRGDEDTYSFFAYVNPHPRPISVALLTGSTPAAARAEIRQRLENGTIDILIGTHALIQEEVSLDRLALAVVDEQHRFGVMQRAALKAKGQQPHLLVMSATPIPRTLALTLYGDLDVSTMPELPAGRLPIHTRFIPPERRDEAELFVIDQVRLGRQAFVVCPLIDESEAVLTRAATEEYERLRTTVFSELRVGLLHGRMPLREKQAVMDAFRQGELDVLVATPVIEVGIDVPNATVMLIEGADRFGLSQLHQLRGRVGRGKHRSYCFLLSETPSEEAGQRLEVLEKTNDGFEIAEADLRLRGPGDFFGTRQSGLPTLKVATLMDRDLIAPAREEARRLLAADPRLRKHPQIAAAVRQYTADVTDEVS